MDSQNSNTMRLSDDGNSGQPRIMHITHGRQSSMAFGLLRSCRARAGQSLR
jgi:hypothetical protein